MLAIFKKKIKNDVCLCTWCDKEHSPTSRVGCMLKHYEELAIFEGRQAIEKAVDDSWEKNR